LIKFAVSDRKSATKMEAREFSRVLLYIRKLFYFLEDNVLADMVWCWNSKFL